MKVKTDQSKSYRSAHEALIDEGFKFDGKYNLYQKDGKYYQFKSMDHFNTTVYSIDLKSVKVNKS